MENRKPINKKQLSIYITPEDKNTIQNIQKTLKNEGQQYNYSISRLMTNITIQALKEKNIEEIKKIMKKK